MARYVDIDNEAFWDILFDEACIEGKQAERIEAKLQSLVVSVNKIRNDKMKEGERL